MQRLKVQHSVRQLIIFSMVLLLPTINAQAADKVDDLSFQDELLRLRLSPRTAEQMAGFFEARGFPPVMIEELGQYCFFTVVIKNKSDKPLWLDLREWRFYSGKQEVRRVPRNQWPPIWKKKNIPMAAQSTFRWTLLPEQLDLQVDESEGGNVILERSAKHFSLEARFALGETGQKGERLVRIDNLSCASLAPAVKP